MKIHIYPTTDMASYYGLYLTLHLLCAILFVGAVFFEVLVIEPLEKRLPPELSRLLAEEIPKQVRRFMPVVVAVLFVTGGLLFWFHFRSRPDFFHTRFGILLSIKVALAFTVLGIFVASIRASYKGTMDLCQFRHTHRIVAVLMLGIVLLAKGIYFL